MHTDKLEVALRRHSKFDDLAAVRDPELQDLACEVLKDVASHGVSTLRLAAQAVMIDHLADTTSGIVNSVATSCGMHRICCTNKILRNKNAHSALIATPKCDSPECNLHADHVVPEVDSRQIDCSYIIPDEFVPVIDR